MFRRVTSRVLRRAHPMLPEQFAPTSEVNNYSRSGKLYDGLFDCDDETSEQGVRFFLLTSYRCVIYLFYMLSCH